jgi:hypothetical protein
MRLITWEQGGVIAYDSSRLFGFRSRISRNIVYPTVHCKLYKLGHQSDVLPRAALGTTL